MRFLLAVPLVAVTLFSLSACEEPLVTERPLPEVPPVQVHNPPAIDLLSRCVELGEGTPIATSPEGDLWVVEGDEVRVLSHGGVERRFDHGFAVPPSLIVPWNQFEAVVATEEGFWHVTEEGPLFLFVPAAVRDAHLFCGDPAQDGQVAILNAEGLFERDAGEWFSVGTEDNPEFVNGNWLSSYDGVCAARGSGTWFGTTFRGEPDQLFRVDGVSLAYYDVPEGMTLDPVVGDGFIAVPAGDRLLFAEEIGPLHRDWAPSVFDSEIEAVSAAGSLLWVAIGGELLRFDGELWGSFPSSWEGQVTSVFAYPGGNVWVHAGDQVCHVGSENTRVRGLRPNEVFLTSSADIRIELVGQVDADVSVSRDGSDARTAVFEEPAEGEQAGWIIDDMMLGSPGWHRLEVSVDGEQTRSLPYRVVAGDVSFLRDVAPIAEQHCARAECHAGGATETIPLTDFDQWSNAAFEISDRVSNGTMPLEAGEDWSADFATTILDWIHGGRRP